MKTMLEETFTDAHKLETFLKGKKVHVLIEGSYGTTLPIASAPLIRLFFTCVHISGSFSWFYDSPGVVFLDEINRVSVAYLGNV